MHLVYVLIHSVHLFYELVRRKEYLFLHSIVPLLVQENSQELAARLKLLTGLSLRGNVGRGSWYMSAYWTSKP